MNVDKNSAQIKYRTASCQAVKSFSHKWQRIIGGTCILVLISLVLNVVCLCLITNTGKDSDISINLLKEEVERNKFVFRHLSAETFKNISLLRTKFRKNSEKFEIKVNEDESEKASIRNELEQLKNRIADLEEKTSENWKKGCPQHGITNGKLCFVLRKEKVNYTTAVTRCEAEGGTLARIPNLQILEEITKILSPPPFFVDGHYNDTAGKWLNSEYNEARNLPWNFNQPKNDGNCVYAYRSGYTAWKCKALFEYLCEF